MQKCGDETKMTKIRFVDLAGSEKIPKIFQQNNNAEV
jgi:hypothetical protein